MSELSPQDEPIAPEDVREIVRLLGRIAGMQKPLSARKRRLMEGLGQLVNADGWFWSLTRVIRENNMPVSMGLIHGGLSENQIASIAMASHSDSPPPEDAPLAQEVFRGMHFTRTRGQLVPNDQWYSHPTVKRHRLDVGIDDFLYSVFPIKKTQVLSSVGFYRHVGKPPFTNRDRRIVHVLMSMIDWLHHADIPDDQGEPITLMSPRRRMTLMLLLEGHDRKTIARLLRIKPNTVKEHIEAVYAHFGVTSQVELICRFRRGDGQDLPAPFAE